MRLWLLVSQSWLVVLGGNRRCQLNAARLELLRDLADQFYRQQPVLEFCRSDLHMVGQVEGMLEVTKCQTLMKHAFIAWLSVFF